MDFEARLIQIIEQASSPGSALEAVAGAIAQDELSDACAVLLSEPGGRLTYCVRAGTDLQLTRDAAEATARESLAKVAPVSHVHARRVMLAAPLLARAQTIGALIVERSSDRPYTNAEVRKLVAIASHVVGVVESARLLDMIEHASDLASPEAVEPVQLPRRERTLRGIAASPGIVIGRCAFRQAVPRAMLRHDFAVHGAQLERSRLREAVDKTRADIKRLQSAIAGELGEECALVFASHLLFLGDPMLLERIEHDIAAGYSAAVAVDRAQGEIIGSLKALGSPYFRERVEDIQDLCSRLLSHLLGGGGSQALTTDLVVSRRFTPSLIVELHGRGAAGIASELGGATSHAVLLARALGFPAVTGVEGLLDHAIAGELLVIDGEAGTVVLGPSEQTLADYRAAIARKEELDRTSAAHRDQPSVTADGASIRLRANVAFGVDIELARANGAQGIGLYRTEFPFLVRDGIPTLEEQCRIYAKAFRAFPHDPIVFRILDLAADKLLPGSGLSPSGDPFAGYRSIRLLFDHPHVLRDQVQAFALAAEGRPLSVLIPMVSSVEDLRRMKRLIADALAAHPDTAAAAAPRIGVLVEVPAAVEVAAELARESDFLSIGTNDLIQYTLVVDREDPRVSTPRDAYHPAVLRMIRRVVLAGHAAGKEVSVCGELANRVGFASVLLALDVDALSVTPRVIPQLKQALASVSVARVRDDLPRMLALATAIELERAIDAHVGVEQAWTG
jgi:phosphoenolpyruvate-protein phosphotransferase